MNNQEETQDDIDDENEESMPLMKHNNENNLKINCYEFGNNDT